MNRCLLTVVAVVAATGTIAPEAHAEDAVKLEDHEAKGYFDKFGRVGAFIGSVGGTNGPVMRNQQGSPGESFSRLGYGVDFDLLGFFDATRFDTLLGAEMLVKLGSYSGPKTDTTAGDKNYLFFRMDAASTYGFLHWDGNFKGRISGGGGFGMDFDGGRWWTQSGRAYALLLGRAQVQAGSVGLHLSYVWVPTTTTEYVVREHRFEAAAAIGSLHAGVRMGITTARAPEVAETSNTRELGAFAAYAF